MTSLITDGLPTRDCGYSPAKTVHSFLERVLVFILIASAALMLCPTTGLAQQTNPQSSTSGRPATVPADYLATPSGWFHPDCVIQVAEDELIASDGNIADLATATLKRTIGKCLHARYDHDGNVVPDASPQPFGGQNVALAYASATTGAMDYLSANWSVPNNPQSTVDGQSLYFYPGFQPLAPPRGDQILQPVVGWNALGDGKTQWTISSWDCCINQNNYVSALVPVTPGLAVDGFAWGQNCNTTTGICANWQVVTSATGVNAVTLNTTTVGEALTWSVGGAYEELGLIGCADHSTSQTMTFSNLYFRKVGDVVVSPTWMTTVTKFTPSCNMSISVPTPTTVSINWCVPQNLCTKSTCGQTISDDCGGTITCPSCCYQECIVGRKPPCVTICPPN
jgi:hypothetical protein